MPYLTPLLLSARVGGEEIYLELTDDDGDNIADAGVERLLLSQVDAIVDAYARRSGYITPLTATDIAPLVPFLLDIANYKAKTRGNRSATEDARNEYMAATKILEEVASGAFRLPSYVPPDAIILVDFDTRQDPQTGCPYWSGEPLEGF